MQFDEYLQQQLLKIENLDDRRIMHKIFESVLVPLQEYCDEKYNTLAERLIKEQENTGQFVVYTGLIERQKYDVTIENMLPMKKEDLLEKQIDLLQIQNSLEQEENAKLFAVYLHLETDKILKLTRSERLFKGFVITDQGEFPAQFFLRPKEDYLKMIRELHPFFIKNGVEWKTICAPYLYKFCDVYMDGHQKIEGTEIKEITIDFEEYKECVSYDMLPLWNLELVTQSTNGYPKACVDRVHYEHVLFKERLGDGEYLVMNSDIEIRNRKRVDGDMLITCNCSENVNWKLMKFHPYENRKWNYPLMGNSDEQPGLSTIRTKAAVELFVSGLGFSAQLQLVDMYVQQEKLAEIPVYHVDEALLFERIHPVVKDETRDRLCFVFEALQEDIYSQDILNYLVTRLQWRYPEYICVGKWQ